MITFDLNSKTWEIPHFKICHMSRLAATVCELFSRLCHCYAAGNHSSDIISISRTKRRARIKKRIDGGTFTRRLLIRHAKSQEQIKCRRCKETDTPDFATSSGICVCICQQLNNTLQRNTMNPRRVKLYLDRSFLLRGKREWGARH